ncbi:gamma-glutamyl-gamma-aminobutyrate hydrolase family protein [Rheinheimera marina]|uniref:Gamma-glutamyl-gamma-aminobutyrate hydrolase family protein n=1 Tax=Rheinheimera marina TaxID=1774958 RepID=A0ABV9JRT1_9GAMM
MKLVAISQRVDEVAAYHERRDSLDQRWSQLLWQCEAIPLLLPNAPNSAIALVQQLKPAAVIFTGGNSLSIYQGDAPERDLTEKRLLAHCITEGIPLLGVCRGMQLIQDHFGQPLQQIEGHVATRCALRFDGQLRDVNSYHNLGCRQNNTPLQVTALAHDGVIKAIRHPTLAIQGIMWHPERESKYHPADIELIKGLIH